MKAISRLVVLTCLASVIAMAAFADAGDEIKYQFHVRGDALLQGKLPITVAAMEVPDLMSKIDAPTAFAAALASIAEVGANVVCFDLEGLSADGKTLAPGTAAKIDAMLEQINWRRLGAMCKLFGPNAPTDPAAREAAAKAAGAACKNLKRVLFWIDGPGADAAVVAFRQAAPGVIVAAPQGADVDVVTQMPTAKLARPTFLAGAIPSAELIKSVHCVLPGTEENRKALDAALADPAESKPWTPDNSKLSEEERKDGFVSLFDGKSFDGWFILGDKKDGFRVNDGMIEWVCTGGKGLYTRDRYENFTLRLEWRINKGGNSGLYIRAPRQGRQSKIGMEFQLQGDTGTPITEQTTGAVYDVIPPRENGAKPEGEWNNVEITFVGSKLKAILNGKVVQDIDFDTNDELKPRLRRGFIGLQDHSCFVAFRNIRIKKL